MDWERVRGLSGQGPAGARHFPDQGQEREPIWIQEAGLHPRSVRPLARRPAHQKPPVLLWLVRGELSESGEYSRYHRAHRLYRPRLGQPESVQRAHYLALPRDAAVREAELFTRQPFVSRIELQQPA